MPTCPNGHQSGSDDWCEVCGHRMVSAAAPQMPPPPPPSPAAGYGYPPPPSATNAGSGSGSTESEFGGYGYGGGAGGGGYGQQPETAQAELCPQCRTPREAHAPFCEECRWNFLTSTATSYTPAAPAQRPPMRTPDPGLTPGGPGMPLPQSYPPPSQQQSPPSPYEYQGSRPSQMNRPAEPLSTERPQQQPSPYEQQQGPPPPPQYTGNFPPSPPPPASYEPQRGDDDWMLSPPGGGQAPTAPPPPQAPSFPYEQRPPYESSPSPSPSPYEQSYESPAQPPSMFEPQGRQAPAGWSVTIAPDRDYFLAMMNRSGPEASGLNLPAYSPEQRVALTGDQITIGRRRHSTGEAPDIDLSVPPEDPGVSHKHAVLARQADSTWAVVDQNSTNGTTLNGGEEPIQPFVPIPLKEGDRVHVGAWTTITIRRA